jgi:uncharacterized protein DUF998
MALTRALLVCGIVAGPIYVVVGVIEMLTRTGFDLRRHSLSLLSNGDLGWVNMTLFVAAGVLVLAGAIGIRRALRGGRAGLWAPVLLGVYGLGLIGAGLFTADPAFGFPPGTPADANAVSWHGLLHFVCGGLGFIALIAACFVFARRFAAHGQRGWAWYSVATGALFFAAFFGIAAGSGQAEATVAIVNVVFFVAAVLAWAWVSTVAAWLRGEIK